MHRFFLNFFLLTKTSLTRTVDEGSKQSIQPRTLFSSLSLLLFSWISNMPHTSLYKQLFVQSTLNSPILTLADFLIYTQNTLFTSLSDHASIGPFLQIKGYINFCSHRGEADFGRSGMAHILKVI